MTAIILPEAATDGIKFEDGTIATIYDWKEHRTPYYRYDWHIGGHNSAAIDRIHEVLDEYRKLVQLDKPRFVGAKKHPYAFI